MDLQLLRGFLIGLQDFLFVVVLVHNLLPHLSGHRAFCDLWLDNSSVLYHLRQDLQHEHGDLLDVVHALAQLLFPCFDRPELQPRIRILESTDHRAFVVATIKLELRVLLEVRTTLVHIETQTRLQNVDRDLGDYALRYHAGLHRPAKIVGLVGCRVLVVCGHTAASYPQPPDRSQHGCTVGIDRDPPV